MTSINFTPDELDALFFAARELVSAAAFAAAPDRDTALLWLGIQHKALEAMGKAKPLHAELANWTPEGAA